MKKSPELSTWGTEQFLRTLIRRGVVDPEDPNIQDTPGRVSRWAEEFFLPIPVIDKTAKSYFKATFPSKLDEMVTVTNVTVFTLCPHHLLPVQMSVSLAYLPSGKVIGLSKLARLANIYARRPIIQEEYTHQVATAIVDNLSSDAAVYAIGKHYCMVMRGVEEPNSKTVTCALFGKFRNEGPRAEFLALMNHNK